MSYKLPFTGPEITDKLQAVDILRQINVVKTEDIIDNLESNISNKPLSAN